MDSTEKTPLWLDLRKEYIDDNFDKLQVYLQRCSASKSYDTFYQITLDLLRKRVEDLLNNLSNRPLHEEDDNTEDPSFNVRLLALYLLVDEDYSLSAPAFVAFMGELKLLNPKYSDTMLEKAVKRLSYERVSSLGFTWQDLENIGTDLFAYKASQATFDAPLQKPLTFSKSGTAVLSKDGLFLTHENEADSLKLLRAGANSLESGVGIALRTSASEKLRQSQESDISSMMEYTTDFMYSMCRLGAKKTVKRLNVYSDNDQAIVRITAIDYNGTIHVRTVDPLYEPLEGVIKYQMPSLVYYYTDTLYRDFHVGDHFKATVTNAAAGKFCIDRQFIRFLMEYMDELSGSNDDFLCKLIDAKPSYYAWFNEFGVPMFTRNTGDYMKGDFALLRFSRLGQGNEYGKVYGEIIDPSNDYDFEEKEVRSACIRAFAESTKPPTPVVVEEKTSKLSPVVLRLLLRQLFIHQKTLLKPSERYRFLANAYIMAELVDDELSASYIKFASTYLRVLVQFVRNEDITKLELEPEPEYSHSTQTLVRLSVLRLLKEYGRKDNSDVLAKTIEDFETELPMIARLARLVQTANSMQGTLSDAAVNVIRREIIKTLSLETENDADLEADNGSSYLGIESGTQEFKTSIVYPSGNNMQPDEFAQNINVMKGICAFLNSTVGGTLYLGVNDQGYVTGIAGDMKYLGHHSIDSYMRYVQDIAKKYLGIDAIPFLRIEPLYDNSVVAIHVEPHPYRVVELLDIAYLRINAESRQMPEKVRQNLIERKMLTNKEKAAAISQLLHAYSQRKCVVLHNYSSSNSGSVSDRRVEAYDVRTEDGLVVCYDLDPTSKVKVKVFNISRIGYVEILDNEPWKHASEHTPLQVDAFHMSGEKSIHISLQLDLFSKNLLVEEFPASKPDLTQDRKDVNVWYYNAYVCNVFPVARFYLGLANRIKILDAPELQTYVKKFVKENLVPDSVQGDSK